MGQDHLCAVASDAASCLVRAMAVVFLYLSHHSKCVESVPGMTAAVESLTFSSPHLIGDDLSPRFRP